MKQPDSTIEPVSTPRRTFGPVPRKLERYELLEELARGGMARVFLCRHRGQGGFQRLYAIKLLHGHLVNEPGYAARFLDEARWAARIHHPNVVSIVDVGHVGRVYYAAMDYVEGCTLKELLVKSPKVRPPHLIVPILIDMLMGLHAAHSLTGDDGKLLGLVHRDVSPANTLVGLDGLARVSDFGISKAMDQSARTAPGIFLGKLAYGAPEQFVTDGRAEPRSDIFAAGSVMWTALTGRPLFLGRSPAATLSNVMRMTVPRPSTRGLKPPSVLDDICLKALERDPAKRFQSAREMALSLREAATNHGLLGSPDEIGRWVHNVCGATLRSRQDRVRRVGLTGKLPDLTPGESGARPVISDSHRPDGRAPDWTEAEITLCKQRPKTGRRPRFTSGVLLNQDGSLPDSLTARPTPTFTDPPESLGDTLDELMAPPSTAEALRSRGAMSTVATWFAAVFLLGFFSAGVWLGWHTTLAPRLLSVARSVLDRQTQPASVSVRLAPTDVAETPVTVAPEEPKGLASEITVQKLPADLVVEQTGSED